MEKLRVGIIGLGFMGGMHLQNWARRSDVDVVAVCDKRPLDATGIKGNIDGSDAPAVDLSGITHYTDVGEMLDKASLDAVSITLPTHLHKDVTLQALAHGVHVLCEKPMALTVEECDEMIAAADQAGKVLMIGHCIRFWPAYAWARQVVADGRYGSVRAADFERLSARPVWSEGDWLSDEMKSGGIALDLHVHDLDFIQYLLGQPDQLEARTAKFPDGVTGHIQTRLSYPGHDAVVSATASWMMPAAFSFGMSFKILLEQALLVYDSRAESSFMVYPAEGEAFAPELEAGDGYQQEIDYFATLICSGGTNTVIPTPEAREAVRLAREGIS